ncbi:MAG: DUF433 domain-containing protein [Planctomycetes bacterium]|nr:DUF433 domain-containing protein [Planctomycetota bacterium]
MAKTHIETVPGKCGGKPVVAGTRIRVWDVYVQHERLGKSPDEIVRAYPHLTLADVHAALAYYWDHKEEIDQQMKDADEFVAELRDSNEASSLARRLAATDSGSDTISP